MIAPERVAAAEYAKRRVLATVTETRFGSFVHDAAHDHRAPATQLLDARLPGHGERGQSACSPHRRPQTDRDVEGLLERVDALYDRHGFDHRILSGVDRATFAHLDPILRKSGYERELYWALVPSLHDDGAAGPRDLTTEATQHGTDGARVIHEPVGRDPAGIAYVADAMRALDGTELVGYLDGEPVGVAGWYCHTDAEEGCADDRPTEAVARYTHIGVHPDARNQGVGAAMVAAVVDRCPLPADRLVVCATEETAGFYEQLGFTRNNHLWRFARLP